MAERYPFTVEFDGAKVRARLSDEQDTVPGLYLDLPPGEYHIGLGCVEGLIRELEAEKAKAKVAGVDACVRLKASMARLLVGRREPESSAEAEEEAEVALDWLAGREAKARDEERARCATLARKAGCSHLPDCGVSYTGESHPLGWGVRLVEHDDACPEALAARIEARELA